MSSRNDTGTNPTPTPLEARAEEAANAIFEKHEDNLTTTDYGWNGEDEYRYEALNEFGVKTALREAYSRGLQEAQRWIRCEERKPEPKEWIWCYGMVLWGLTATQCWLTREAMRVTNGPYEEWRTREGWSFGRVTHWLPFPPAPTLPTTEEGK